jgi:hypothetical protein
MRCGAPRYHRTEGASIVMLIASGLLDIGWEARAERVVTHNPVAPEGRRSTPGGPTPASVPSGGWFWRPRQADWPFPSTWRFHGWPPLCHVFPASAPDRSPSLSPFRHDRLKPACQSRVFRCICGSPSRFRGIDEACFPIELRTSQSDHLVAFSPLVSEVSLFILRCGSPSDN